MSDISEAVESILDNLIVSNGADCEERASLEDDDQDWICDSVHGADLRIVLRAALQCDLYRGLPAGTRLG